MTKKLLLSAILVAYGIPVLAQATAKGVAENNLRMANFIHAMSTKEQALVADRTLNLSDIEGSMYYVEAFIPGQIYYSDKAFKTIPMRYNAYTDEIEIKRDDQETAEALLKDSKVSCEVNGERLVYSEYLDKKGNLENGYLVKIFAGQKYNLYEKRSKTFKEGQQPKTSLHLPTPDKFVGKSEFYLTADSETPKFLPDSKKKLSTVFDADKIGVLKTFIKKNDIDLSKKEDLQRLLGYAETVTAEGKGV
ncbi:hypothetical protein [Ulvibacterium marinum]|uniref:hypothetical protein n=1 Tax=Ulvibacterium marinum TaxID=2419782 RepID=UPI0024941735|nr:hypothetical protein [Ulvibacterium marinum]